MLLLLCTYRRPTQTDTTRLLENDRSTTTSIHWSVRLVTVHRNATRHFRLSGIRTRRIFRHQNCARSPIERRTVVLQVPRMMMIDERTASYFTPISCYLFLMLFLFRMIDFYLIVTPNSFQFFLC